MTGRRDLIDGCGRYDTCLSSPARLLVGNSHIQLLLPVLVPKVFVLLFVLLFEETAAGGSY